LAHVLQQGADVIIRAGWKGARWLDAKGERFDIQAALQEAETVGLLDQSVCIGRKKGPALSLRLVAFRLPPIKAEEARARARRAAKREDYAVSGGTLAAAGWIILVTSLDAGAFPAAKISELYRIRWRIEMAFKRLKTIIGLSAPPSEDPEVAKTWILAHLLMALLLESQTSAPEFSPRMAA
jgi:IS4 transposase